MLKYAVTVVSAGGFARIQVSAACFFDTSGTDIGCGAANILTNSLAFSVFFEALYKNSTSLEIAYRSRYSSGSRCANANRDDKCSILSILLSLVH